MHVYANMGLGHEAQVKVGGPENGTNQRDGPKRTAQTKEALAGRSKSG